MKKLYYSIGEVSELTNVEPHVLRYWETIFKELSPRKNRAGNRTYREKDITLILKLKDLIQDNKYSTAGAQKVLEDEKNQIPADNESSEKLPFDAVRDLKEIRRFLLNLSEKL
ncbi:MAG: MerR family transcriptional regulator [Balneolaceae bacterium]|nr:MAG: MerR family transcriptional regulator [Balneolaceae bacterium]